MNTRHYGTKLDRYVEAYNRAWNKHGRRPLKTEVRAALAELTRESNARPSAQGITRFPNKTGTAPTPHADGAERLRAYNKAIRTVEDAEKRKVISHVQRFANGDLMVNLTLEDVIASLKRSNSP